MLGRTLTTAGVVILTAATLAQAQGAPAPAGEPALTNDDVVKLCKLELGDEVVMAKINQAAQVAFQLDTDSLINLKAQGVSGAVIEAMLNRTAARHGEGGQGTTLPVSTAGQDAVILRTSDREIPLESVQGDLSSVYAFAVFLLYLDFPGLAAEVRITEPRPTFVARLNKGPRGRIFLVKCERDEDDDVRSVKVGKASPFGMKSWSTPDKDWVIDCAITETAQGEWEITPQQDLRPGEYGILFRGGVAGLLGPQQAELFDFAVE